MIKIRKFKYVYNIRLIIHSQYPMIPLVSCYTAPRGRSTFSLPPNTLVATGKGGEE